MSGPYSRWQDALHAQMRLAQFYNTERGALYLHSFYASMNAKTTPDGRRDVGGLARLHYEALLEAEPVWVAEEAVQLVDHARHSFEPEPVLATDPFVPAGFALLAEPIMLHDAPYLESRPGRAPSGEVPVRAIAWMPVHNDDATEGCFWVHYFVHVDDELALGKGSKWSPEEAADMRTMAPLLVGHTFQWTWGEAPWREPERLEIIEGESVEETEARARQQSQLAQALWRIGSQFVPARAHADRHLRRQAQRHKLVRGNDVTVIRLRRAREYGEPDEPSGRQLTVQHLVRGYWATRHTREGPRQVWVRAHVKGPADAPFRQTTRAWEFTR